MKIANARGSFSANLIRALHVNFKDEVLPPRARLLQPAARSAVPVPAEHLGVFQKLSRISHALKFLFADEIVPLAFRFRPTRRTSGAGNG